MTGRVLGHYRIVSEIGRGGMGAVYRARDEVLERDVAVKVLGGGKAGSTGTRDLLLEEARAASALSHPNICMVHEVGEAEGESYIVMELVEGKTLSALIGSTGLPVDTVLRYGGQIAAALAHAHGRNFVHRDLKSSNVVVRPEGLVKVLDFGLARRLPQETASEATRTLDTRGPVEISGTLSYMAPEIFRGEPADQRSDLWALGVVLYEAASGQQPFQGRTAFEISSAVLREPPPPLASSIPAGLWAIIQRCLTKEPEQRYQRASEVQAALEAVLSASIVSASAPRPEGPRHTVLRGIPHIQPKRGDVLLLIGTVKGAFLVRSTRDRKRWETGGPYFHGQAAYAMAYDGRNGLHRIWASTQSVLWGTFLRSTDDFGKIWTNPLEASLRFPAETGVSLKNIWQICLGRSDEPGKMYCGAEPAALFESSDYGETWSMVRGLYDHPHRARWVPGNGGLALHTIVPDPSGNRRMYIAISAGGVYRTDDGGATWVARNRGIRVTHMPDKYPEFGQCVHKVVLHPARPERLFLQNHWGIYRSDDAADSWHDIGGGVPSDFGFAMVVHPQNPDWLYILPVESDEFRCSPEGRLRVYRTRNAGGSWEALSRGLPQKGAFETVLRDAMTADSLDPVGLYFGTRSGKLYQSADEGKSWTKILEGLPAIVCVKAALVGEPRPVRNQAAAVTRPAPRSPRKIARKKAGRRGKRK